MKTDNGRNIVGSKETAIRLWKGAQAGGRAMKRAPIIRYCRRFFDMLTLWNGEQCVICVMLLIFLLLSHS